MGLKRMLPLVKLETYLKLKAQKANLETQIKDIRNFIMDSFDSPINVREVINVDGIEVMKYPTGINTPSFDKDAAAKILTNKNLSKLATVMVPTISQDKVKEMLVSGLITAEEYNDMLRYNVVANIKVEDKRFMITRDIEGNKENQVI